MKTIEIPLDYDEPLNAWHRIKAILIAEDYHFAEYLYDIMTIEHALHELKKIKEGNQFPFKTIQEYRDFIKSLKNK